MKNVKKKSRRNMMAIPVIKPYAMPVQSEFPKNRVSWTVDASRSVLLIHDMQQYFLNAFTRNASPFVELVRNITILKEECESLNIPIVYTAQPGAQNQKDRALLTDFWGPGLQDDVSQTKIIPEIAPSERDTVLTKWRYSAFKRSDLLERMQQQGRDQLIICGVYAHIGCLLTASDAFMQDIQPFFVGDAVADFSLEEHKMALHYAAGRCAATISITSLLENLKSSVHLNTL